MIHKYYYLFTRPSVIVVCWKSIFFKSLQFFQGRIIWITFGWGALGAETLCLSGVKICPCNTLGGNLGRQVENVCPLGAEKGQNLPSSALRSQRYFMGKFSPLTSIKFLPPMPPIQKWSKLFAPEKIEETWKKLTFNTLLLH